MCEAEDQSLRVRVGEVYEARARRRMVEVERQELGC